MSEFKGTPGPWAVNDQRANGWMNNAMYVGSDCTGQILARVYNETNDEEANARLIAAAPELLEALERIASETAATWVSDVARAAIAKATGES